MGRGRIGLGENHGISQQRQRHRDLPEIEYGWKLRLRLAHGSVSLPAQKTTVGSGVMIRLEDLYFTTTEVEKANTIFHELTHKLILTNDGLGYDPAKLLAAATQKPEQAIKNAENWTQFYAEFLSGASSRSTSSGGGAVAGSSRPSPRALLGRCGGQ